MADVAAGCNKPDSAEPLSDRDRKLLAALVAGDSEKTVGASFGITQQRVNQIRHTPAAVAYLHRHGGDTKMMLYAKAGAEILARMDWGGMKLADLIAIWKAAMPQELTINQTVVVRQEAKRIAEELGMTVDEVLAEAEAIVAGARS